jgi:hypothetical protein
MSCDYVEVFIHQDIRYDQYELMMIINVTSLKTQRVVGIMMLIEEGLTWAWPR